MTPKPIDPKYVPVCVFGGLATGFAWQQFPAEEYASIGLLVLLSWHLARSTRLWCTLILISVIMGTALTFYPLIGFGVILSLVVVFTLRWYNSKIYRGGSLPDIESMSLDAVLNEALEIRELSERFIALQNRLAENPEYAFHLAKDGYWRIVDIPKLQEAACKDPEIAFQFAVKVHRADVSSLQRYVSPQRALGLANLRKDEVDLEVLAEIATQNPIYAYAFACEYPSTADRLQHAVLSSPEWAFKFARDVEGANVTLLQRATLSDPRFAYLFAKEVHGADAEELFEAVKGTDLEEQFWRDVSLWDVYDLVRREGENEH